MFAITLADLRYRSRQFLIAVLGAGLVFVEIPLRAYLLLPVAALLVGLAASLAGVRQTVTADPARAFT